MATLKINRQFETIDVKNEDGTVAYSWQVLTDDESITKMLNMLGNAMDRFSTLQQSINGADTEDSRKKQEDAMVRLLKRCITAILGERGYTDILTYIGDGIPAKPAENIINMGEVFAALCTWLYDRCTSKQLREAGSFFKRVQTHTASSWSPSVHHGSKKKK